MNNSIHKRGNTYGKLQDRPKELPPQVSKDHYHREGFYTVLDNLSNQFPENGKITLLPYVARVRVPHVSSAWRYGDTGFSQMSHLISFLTYNLTIANSSTDR